jgi:hypothetical protein
MARSTSGKSAAQVGALAAADVTGQQLEGGLVRETNGLGQLRDQAGTATDLVERDVKLAIRLGQGGRVEGSVDSLQVRCHLCAPVD